MYSRTKFLYFGHHLYFIIYVMKKLSLLWVLLLVLVVAGCSWWWNKEKEANVTKADIDVESCVNYFELVDCIIDNDTDDTYSQSDREMIRASVDDMRNSWASLDDNTLDELCTKEISKFQWDEMAEYLSQINCSLD